MLYHIPLFGKEPGALVAEACKTAQMGYKVVLWSRMLSERVTCPLINSAVLKVLRILHAEFAIHARLEVGPQKLQCFMLL